MKKYNHAFVMKCVLGLLWLCMGCQDDGYKINPNKVIIGRWEIVEDYFGPVNSPGWYEEYSPDGICMTYNYKDQAFYPEKYWFTDSLLIKSFLIIDPYDKDTIEFRQEYRYRFIGYHKLRLEFTDLALNPFSIYRRIE